MVRFGPGVFFIYLWVLAPLVFTSSGLSSQDATCILTDGKTGRSWDLRGLSRSTGRDYEVQDQLSGDVFQLNVCRSILTETWGIEDSASVGVYRSRDGQKGQSLGKWNKSMSLQGDSVTMIYGQGSNCGSTSQSMVSIIAFECAQDVRETGNPAFVGSTPDGCAYFFKWSTSYACHISNRRGFWSGLLHFLITLIIMVLIGGGLTFFYRHFVKGDPAATTHPRGTSRDSVFSTAKDLVFTMLSWCNDQMRQLGRALSSALTKTGGQSSGWTTTTTGGGAWWEAQHLDPNNRAATNTENLPTEDGVEVGKGHFGLGPDDTRREEARNARVVHFDHTSRPAASAGGVSATSCNVAGD